MKIRKHPTLKKTNSFIKCKTYILQKGKQLRTSTPHSLMGNLTPISPMNVFEKKRLQVHLDFWKNIPDPTKFGG